MHRLIQISLVLLLSATHLLAQTKAESRQVRLDLKLTFETAKEYVYAGAGWLYLPKRQQILVFHSDTTKVIDLETGKSVKNLPPMRLDHNHYIKELNPDESRLVTFGFFGKEAELWDISNARLIAKLPKRKKSIDHVQWSVDGRFFVLNSSPSELEKEHYIFESARGRVISTITTKEKSFAQFNPRENSILTGESFLAYRRDHLKLWNVETGALIKEFRLPFRAQNVGALISPDGQNVLVQGRFSPVHVFDIASSELVSTLEIGFGRRLRFSPDGRLLLVDRNKFRGLRKHDEIWFEVYNTEKYDLQMELRTGKAGKHQVEQHQIVWRPDGRALGSAGETYAKNYEAESWDVSTGKQKFLLSPLVAKRTRAFMEGGYDYYDELSFTPDSKLLITESRGENFGGTNVLCIWDAETGALVRRFDQKDGDYSFTSDKKYLTKIDGSQRISIYELTAE